MQAVVKSRIPALLRTSLAQRIVSSLILAPGALVAAYTGGAVFAAVVAFAAIVMVFEWTRMIEKREFSPAFYALAAASAAALTLAAAGRFPISFAICGLAAFAGGVLASRVGRRPLWVGFGALYILAPCAALIWLREAVENGRALTIMLLLIVWAADTGGYVGGRLVGGPKMNPVLSPAKTWAGAAGGVIFGALAGLACARWIYGAGPFAVYAVAGGCLGLASILGDMAESAFKRVFGVKDTSGFIPGHGGFLDRLDGMIFATTAMTLALFLHMIAGRING
ncbi:MAG: phosphatidate cytidylyltransferase [Amphiplicatus sp.]